MKKIAIVGVEGSGKTVLMAAMGEKYRKPRADGLFLYANSRRTIEYCNEQIDILRIQHKWPNSTSPDSLVNLEWTLMRRKKGSRPEEVCTVAFLDFAGEIYRYAFGDSTDDSDRIKQSQYKKQIEAVKSHLKDAESVVVLVNLSDIINSNGVSTKASEMDWLSQRIFDFAFDETSANRVAIAFTQKDLYEETIGRCGGLEGTFEAYLPSVYYRHESEIVPFAVSAVNKTVPNDKGEPLPASDFNSEGFDELVSWMADVSDNVAPKDSKPKNSDSVGQIKQKTVSAKSPWRYGCITMLAIMSLIFIIYIVMNATDKPIVPNNVNKQSFLPRNPFHGHLIALSIPGGGFIEMIYCEPGHSLLAEDDVKYGFWMSKYEVTQAQWQLVMGTNPSVHKGGVFRRNWQLPVDNVSWDDCQEFIEKINSTMSVEARLPTAKEWRYACLAGQGKHNARSDRRDGWSKENCNGKRHPVGQ